MLLPTGRLRKGSTMLSSQQKQGIPVCKQKGTTTIALALDRCLCKQRKKADPSAQGQAYTAHQDNLRLVLYSNSTLPMPIFKSLNSVSHLNGKHTRDPLWYLKISSSFRGSTLAYRVQPETTKSMKNHLKHKDKREALNSWVMHVGCQEQKAFNSFETPEDTYARYLCLTHMCAVPLH